MRTRSSSRPWGAVAAVVFLAALCLRAPAARGQVIVQVRATTRIELWAEPIAGGVVGRLLDDRGAPLPGRGVTLVARDAAGSEETRVRTDGTGAFSAPVGFAGESTVTASFAGDELYDGSSGSLAAPALGAAGGERAEDAVSERPSSAWLLLPSGICLFVLFGAHRLAGHSLEQARGKAQRRGRSDPHGGVTPAGVGLETSLRARAAAAFRPAALAVLPSATLWHFATPRETVELARGRSGEGPQALRTLADQVERRCYGPAEPTAAEVEALEHEAVQVARALRAPGD